MSSLPKETPPEDANNESFWMPGNYQRTVKRTEDSFQACNDIVACFQERARVERQYAQHLSEWSSKWKPLVDTSPLYGSLLQAWQCFLSSAERLSALHSSICRALVSEDGDRVRTWQKETFHKKMFGGFRESQDFETGFARAQKPWAKRLKKLDKARGAYHKACRKEQTACNRETHAKGNPDIAIEKQRKIQEERELASEETKKMRTRYEKVLEEVTRYAPRYMEEMESIFDQSQEEERKRISFLKQAFLSIHRHLDITNNESMKAVYSELHQTLMAISEQEDLRWWRNTHGPGMPTDWPQFQEFIPDNKQKKGKKPVEQTDTLERSVMIGGVKVRALYDYIGQDPDELSFKAGEEFLKIEDEDDQGWCRGMKDGGREGLYPANYVEVLQ
ncbi:protein kinase C and casein kinase substrate in neurons protein 3 [Megalops cyprinoides]|uniref:protein kinase C and casein kinase substrate in neurons protein 3 n=1 Tax=Megalops cyprinoides TaxID=118141 RepID=UPI001863FAF9|nr:protein kinase C and casein kinase substrate in neurons protein 3 [Megalops cyprinoides]